MRRIAATSALVIILAGGVYGSFTSLTGEPDEIEMNVTPSRPTVAVGEEFTLQLEIENVSVRATTINSIGLEQAVRDGVEVISAEPAFRSSEKRNYPFIGAWYDYRLDQTLAGGDKLLIALTLRATQAGTYSGDIMAWIDSDFLGITIERARRESITIDAQ